MTLTVIPTLFILHNWDWLRELVQRLSKLLTSHNDWLSHFIVTGWLLCNVLRHRFQGRGVYWTEAVLLSVCVWDRFIHHGCSDCLDVIMLVCLSPQPSTGRHQLCFDQTVAVNLIITRNPYSIPTNTIKNIIAEIKFTLLQYLFCMYFS